MSKIFISQRTKRQVVKKLDASYLYESHFGSFGTIKLDNTGLNFPWGIITDGSSIYVCDNNNKRIVKLDATTMNYVSSINVSNEIGRPFTGFYDPLSGDIYVAGIHNYRTVSVARISTALSVIKFNNDVHPADTNEQPMGISFGFAGDILVSGFYDLLRIDETGGGFNPAVDQPIAGESGAHFLGHTMHSNGNLYLNVQRLDNSGICKVDSSYINIGDSDIISKASFLVVEGTGGSLLVYDDEKNRVLRYDSNMNYLETVYENTGTTVQLDAIEVCGIAEIS